MSLYTRARKHIDMKRVKEMREEKIKREKIAEILRQQEEIRAELAEIEVEESKHVDWRQELDEAMTTDSLGMVNYPAEGNIDLDTAYPNFTLSGPSGHGYNSVTRYMQGNRSKFDTIVIRVNSNSTDWSIVHGSIIELTYGSGGIGSKTVVIPAAIASVYYTAKDDGSISFETVYQRRKPVNVFVGLDDPEANSFIRGGLGGDENRKQKLKDQLEASNELMIKMGLDPSKTSPGDILISPGKALYGPVDNRLKPDGSKGFNTPGELNKGNDGNWYEWDGNKWNPVPSLGLA